MTVHFIGAGPGAADLITVRGRDLIARCPVCLYAGSIVAKELLDWCPPGARLVDTAPLSLDEIERGICRRRTLPARMWRGCIPAIFRCGARSPSRCAGFDKLGIPYTLTPGVPAFAAAAASLGRELTIPEVAQSLVLTRVSGRASPMPPKETLAAFGATGATLAIHLAIHAIDRIVEELTPLYGADCPVAIVFHASWPDERDHPGHAGNIAAELAGAADRAHGDHLRRAVAGAEDFRESSLYDAYYQRRFRGRE